MTIELQQVKNQVNQPKSRLLAIADQVEESNPEQAEILRDIIAQLEDWQNNRVVA
jgi:PHD/YefM family antitoxin component YafN of YafNO toxin-antitoxin module